MRMSVTQHRSRRGGSLDCIDGIGVDASGENSHPPGEDRDMAVNNRNIVAKMMTPAQIAEAEKLAREWKPK